MGFEDRQNSMISISCSHKTDIQLAWPAFVLYTVEMDDLLRTAYQGVSYKVMCAAADNRLRERELCNHEQHFDMVPPLPYMHVIWGNISAVQVGILLRFDNTDEQLSRIEEGKGHKEKSYSYMSEVDLLAKDAFNLLERLLRNICTANQIQVVNGRDFNAYLEAAKSEVGNEAYKALSDIRKDHKSIIVAKELFDAAFIRDVLKAGRSLLPDLPDIKTSDLAATAYYEPTLEDKIARQKVQQEAADEA